MKTIHTIIGWAVGTAFGLSGCAADADIELPVPGNVPVALSGIMTRGAEANDYPNLHLMAKLDGKEDVYIPETPITCSRLEATTPKDITITDVFYPIGDTKIRFFAYSGTATDGKMTLTAGTEQANDAILSNYGTQKAVTGTSTEGEGTPGTAETPANVLQFRHVMTQLNVSVVLDNTELPAVDPVPTSIELELTGAVQKGTYPITAVTPTGATGDEAEAVGTDRYLIKKGTNYLVPNGAVLSGTGLFQKLKIDDYTATTTDLANFKIGYVSNSDGSNATNGALKLLPGYSYNLEFKVKRLKVTGITVKKVDWVATEIKDNDVSYTPQELVLDLGSYNTTANEDTITKVVLYEKVETNKAKQYVGDYLHTKGLAKFVTLPPATATIDSVELYTSKGLLINGAKSTSYADNGTNGKKLILLLSAGGMLPENPSDTYSEANPYLIKTALQFLNVTKDLTAHYKQGVSIDMERLSDVEITPLGVLTGSYDGNGFQILHLNLKGAGLFASNAGTLKNIRIVSGTVNGSGEGDVGGICGSNSGIIVACTNQARIINAPTNVGGICGSNSGTITACLNTGNIPSGTVVGGICGTNTKTAGGAITACVNTGMLNRAATNLAGICGSTTNSSSTKVLQVCYWLTGTAEKEQGDSGNNNGDNDWNGGNAGLNNEVGVNGVTLDNAADVADLSPQKLRDNEIITLLNTAISAGQYHFVLAAQTTGCTWPIPLIKKP